ncbi:hypothetical protein [Variovorax paradoxus]|uniref:hypothetical protein n=1 Tax=Variovorax paradoxus TaxID=34073 RepID=UPI003ECE13E8
MGWIFHSGDPMGGATGEAFANTLKSPGMLPEHVLARESIQNSVDAGVESLKVVIKFRARSLVNSEKKNFVAAAGLSDIAARAKLLELPPNCLSTIDKPKTPLSLLYVEDYNAEGLSGEPHDKGSNFHRLLLSLGDRSKARTARGTGGSYGFGKSVYSSSSAIQTIFAYTRFKGADGNEHTRVFGCGYYASHEIGDDSFSGRAWLGTDEHPDAKGRSIVDPLEDKAADELAAKLGFVPRAQGERGTSILIVDADVNMQEIVRGVEDWWWPRLEENKLDVEIWAADGSMVVPRPKKNDALKPFIEAFDLARGRGAAKPGQELYKPNAEGGVQLGTCGFVVVPANSAGGLVVPPDRCNTIALIRAPLMVVAYMPVSELSPPAVGAYVAPDIEEVDLALKKSEPPAHDRWDPASMNLRDETGQAKKLVVAILSRVKAALKRFQSKAAPPAQAKQRRLSILERALGGYFKPQGHGGGLPIEAGQSPLHLDFTKQPFAEPAGDGMLRLKSTFVVTLDDAAEEFEVDLRLALNCPVLENENEEGDSLAMKVHVDGVSCAADPTDPMLFRFKLAKAVKAKFKVESEPYDPSWTVRLRPEIEREEA